MPITELTDSQVAKFPEYVEKFVNLGLSATQISLESATKDFTEFREKIFKETKSVPVIMFDSPSETMAAVKKSDEKFGYIVDRARHQFYDEIIEQILVKVNIDVLTQVSDQVWDQVRGKINRVFRMNVGKLYWNTDIQNKIFPNLTRYYESKWFAYFEFFRNECGIEYKNDNYNLLLKCSQYSMVFFMNDVTIVCQNPTIFRTNFDGLHCINGPAVSYNGKDEMYFLNGDGVSKKLLKKL